MSDSLHIYGQYAQHSDAYIAGSRESLIRLRNLIDYALENNVEGMNFFANDGEGYSIYVYCLPEEIMENLSVPYTCEHAQDNRNYYPWNVRLNN